MKLCRIDQSSREQVDAFIVNQWFTLEMVVHGEVIDLGTADGWYACENDEVIGLITYRIIGDELEILSLDSRREGKGVGTTLLGKAVEEAMSCRCRRIMLVTTNDNLSALRFYQRRGFDLVCVHRNAVDRARQLKPEIPLLGEGDIPLRHELELEMLL